MLSAVPSVFNFVHYGGKIGVKVYNKLGKKISGEIHFKL